MSLRTSHVVRALLTTQVHHPQVTPGSTSNPWDTLSALPWGINQGSKLLHSHGTCLAGPQHGRSLQVSRVLSTRPPAWPGQHSSQWWLRSPFTRLNTYILTSISALLRARGAFENSKPESINFRSGPAWWLPMSLRTKVKLPLQQHSDDLPSTLSIPATRDSEHTKPCPCWGPARHVPRPPEHPQSLAPASPAAMGSSLPADQACVPVSAPQESWPDLAVDVGNSSALPEAAPVSLYPPLFHHTEHSLT